MTPRAARALLAVALGVAGLHAHASKFPVAPFWVYLTPIVVISLASIVFAIGLARVCHRSRSRIKHAILGAILGPVAANAAAGCAFLIVFLPLSAFPDLVPSYWTGPVELIASAVVFLALMLAAFRIASRYSASPAPGSKRTMA